MLHETSQVGVAARVRRTHVVEPGGRLPRHPTHFDPSFRKLNGCLRHDKQYSASPDARHVIDTHFEPSSHDMAGTIRHALPR